MQHLCYWIDHSFSYTVIPNNVNKVLVSICQKIFLPPCKNCPFPHGSDRVKPVNMLHK